MNDQLPETHGVSFSSAARIKILRAFPKHIQDNDAASIDRFIKQVEVELNRYLTFKNNYKYELNDFLINKRGPLIKEARALQRTASKILKQFKTRNYNPETGWNCAAEYQLCQLADQAETGARIWMDTHGMRPGRYSLSSKDFQSVLIVRFQAELDRLYSIATGKFPDNQASAPAWPFDLSTSVSGFNKVWEAIRKTNLVKKYAPELCTIPPSRSRPYSRPRDLTALRKQKQRRADDLKDILKRIPKKAAKPM